ncbi:hypothetical protein N7468_001527 [Penicillium chermesinum]|uniref:Aminoglycoside phosphotransferase domain-containing protein n=1 Tax=Penicillium chermesinum TaxID=63820 RepID=A0A9W9PGQ7_9EURO|nr:uncharacterized protein N7468_001527 [Penicillium chermesinum]KAJ5246544.1 hypothetical protein N7468_001527 [Penicillium chermesinum]KAJ6144812.1 hypothetical protein N7470_008707 [Penicillium chermesinum]
MSQDLKEGERPPAILEPRCLLRGEITYSAAKEEDSNILHELRYRDEKIRFFTHISRNRKLIRRIIGRHLGLPSDACHLVSVEDWIDGSFNVCIRADIDEQGSLSKKQVMVRFPLPYRIGESPHPGNSDEKIRCEAGTYAWLEENCPDVPIPRLYGFGLSTWQNFTRLDNVPLITRAIHYLRRRLLGWLGYPAPSSYVSSQIDESRSLGSGYILIEYIDSSRGKMLSDTWDTGRHDQKLRTNLFRGLSRIMISLTRIPLPRIGSFILDDSGYLRLSNRPLTLQIQLLENEHIPVDIPRHITHSTADSYIHDILNFHENRFRYQPNAISSLQDGVYQACALTVIRSVWPCFFRHDLLRGPFFLQLTDLHQSNIFVDEDWNIKCLIDLEWASTRPVEMLHPPHWLSGQPITEIDVEAYEILHKEFLAVLKEEEQNKPALGHSSLQLHSILQEGWERGTFWCSLALNTPMALFEIFYNHIQPRFAENHKDEESFWLITMRYWTFGTFKFLEDKLKDKEQYDRHLHEAFTSPDA